MAFLTSAQAAVVQLPANNPLRVVLEFLLQHGRGCLHAQVWGNIEAHLTAHGIYMSREQFQQGILKETRGGDIFIGSNDHNPRGYFLIENEVDAAAAREFYTRRIAAQQANLNRLDRLIQQEWHAGSLLPA